MEHLVSSLSGTQAASSVLLLLLISYLLYGKFLNRKKRQGLPLPSGPSGWPIIGNALDMPLESMGPVYASWAKSLGSEIISASALGTTILVIDSYDTAVELLDKRAARYSCRPTSVMACELMGWNSVFALNPYSEAWRKRRKLFVKYFNSTSPDGEPVHIPQVYEFVNRFLVDLSETPSEANGLVKHMVGSMAISLAYGLPIRRRHDDLIELVDSIVKMVAEQVAPGKAIVDVIPWLKHIPSWMPGMGFKRFAESVRWMAVKFKMEPYDRAVEAFGTAGVRPSFLSDALADYETGEAGDTMTRSKELDAIQDVAATIFGTAGDTTANAILTFIFALATRPTLRRRIQDEMDSLLLEYDRDRTGGGTRTLRLPRFEDEAQLPLLTAAVMESQRWAPVTPIGIPHRTTADDVYKGYFIPAGSVVIANQWSMLNDEKEHTGALGVEINPEIRNPNTIAFGFGRRICPGSHIAQSTLWLTAASLLTLFDFEAPGIEQANYVDAAGRVDERFEPGPLCRPKKFECEIKLRSDEAKVLVRELAMQV
ncbi:hypothetical protein NMY22_g5158 [Coprinellus aureogranulatus]|nr:hypothetical protein NMY22_g5158 [Coprinellus aureogranulatus]